MKYIPFVLSISLFILVGCGKTELPETINADQATLGPIIDVEIVPFTHRAILQDVTEGKEIRGISTGGAAAGTASARLVDGAYEVKASFTNLPTPIDDDFYEGWVVRKSPLSIKSTGAVVSVDGVYQNSYMSPEDMLDHVRYVLTIEPNDGDPAPATHIVEADFVE